MRKSVGLNRLLKLAEFLETKVPRKQFDMRNWVGASWKGEKNLSCGTTACAMGWATTIPSFRRLGLRLNREGEVRLDPDDSVLEDGFEAAERLFSITGFEAYELFSFVDPDGYERKETPKQVAKRIRDFCKRKIS